MASNTSHYNLRKPDPADVVDVGTDIGENMDILDAAVAANAAAVTAEAATRASAISALNGTYVPAATPFTVETDADTYRGGTDTMQCLVFPADQPVLAWKVAGDAYPRMVIAASGYDYSFVQIGDGTFDPVQDSRSAGFYYADNGGAGGIALTGLVFFGGGARTSADIEIQSPGAGLILRSPDNTQYKITVNDDGSLSTTVVP